MSWDHKYHFTNYGKKIKIKYNKKIIYYDANCYFLINFLNRMGIPFPCTLQNDLQSIGSCIGWVEVFYYNNNTIMMVFMNGKPIQILIKTFNRKLKIKVIQKVGNFTESYYTMRAQSTKEMIKFCKHKTPYKYCKNWMV